MRMNAMIRITGLLMLLLASAMVQAQTPEGAALHAREAWIRAAPPQAPVRAGYLLLENTTDHEIIVDAVHSEAFGAIEIHEMHDVDGVMRMRRVPHLAIQAGASASLQPGGLHLMLFRPTGPLDPGAEVEIRFLAGDEEVASARFEVRGSE